MGYKIQVKKAYRPLVGHVTKGGYVESFKSKRPLVVKTRKQAEKVKMHMVMSAFPKAKSKQSKAFSMFRITSR